jgi:hypothetical protein
MLREVPDQKGNVFCAFSQGWDMDGKYVQSVKQIGAERLLADHCAQIAIGRRNEPGIRAKGTGTAQTLELSLLQDTQ